MTGRRAGHPTTRESSRTRCQTPPFVPCAAASSTEKPSTEPMYCTPLGARVPSGTVRPNRRRERAPQGLAPDRLPGCARASMVGPHVRDHEVRDGAGRGGWFFIAWRDAAIPARKAKNHRSAGVRVPRRRGRASRRSDPPSSTKNPPEHAYNNEDQFLVRTIRLSDPRRFSPGSLCETTIPRDPWVAPNDFLGTSRPHGHLARNRNKKDDLLPARLTSGALPKLGCSPRRALLGEPAGERRAGRVGPHPAAHPLTYCRSWRARRVPVPRAQDPS